MSLILWRDEMMFQVKTMQSMFMVLAVALTCSLQLTCAHSAGDAKASETAEGKKLTAFLERVDNEDLKLNPQARLGRGDFRFAGEYGDLISDAFFAEAEKKLRTQLKDSRSLQRDKLGLQERIALDTWTYLAEYTLRSYTDGHSQITRQLPVDQLFGHHLTFQQLSSGSSVARFETVKDYEDGLKRFDGFVLYLNRATGRMREGLAAGRTQPRFITQNVITQLNRAIDTPVIESPFYAPIKSLPATFSAADKTRFARAYENSIRTKIYPALNRLRTFMSGRYLEAGRVDKPGLAGMKSGAALYDYVLESHTTIAIPATEIHELGLREVARIRAEMNDIRVKLGFSGTLTEFFEHVKTNEIFRYVSRDAVFAHYRDIAAKVDAVYPRLFNSRPKSALDIKPYPPEQETSGGGAYYLVGTPDGKRPGTFFINLGKLEDQSKPRATALFLHEAVPGHHVQGSLAQENTSLPPVLRFTWNPGYGEGWALYAEWLGAEMGLYDDPMQYFGRLDMEIFRAVRLVVDTGLHAKAWTREQAIGYMRENTSLPANLIEQEVDRYIVWPGQAVSYKVGEIFIRQLRSKAENALGAKFDIRAFHDQVLNTGALPLRVLERKVDDWIARTKSAG
jgi:uncharacterized protein (DUF885 family)